MRRYPPELKEKAVARALDAGNTHAAKELDIPKGTIDAWRAAKKRAIQAKEGSDEEVPTGSNEESNSSNRQRGRVARTYTPSERVRAFELAARVEVSQATR